MERITDGFDIFIPGRPAAKGSTKSFAFVRKHGPKAGKLGVGTKNDDSRGPQFEALIRDTIRLQVRSDRLHPELPSEVRIQAFFHRPQKHYRTGKRGRELRDDAPVRMTEKPDGDKVLRLVLDALTGVAYLDDKQVCNTWSLKSWADRWTEPEGVRIVVDYWSNAEVEQLARRMAGGKT